MKYKIKQSKTVNNQTTTKYIKSFNTAKDAAIYLQNMLFFRHTKDNVTFSTMKATVINNSANYIYEIVESA